MNAPQFPTGSLAGNFPGFPVNYAQIPNIIDLPGWVASMVGYYADVFNAPYPNPPQLQTWAIPYPNLLGIPQFLWQLVVWTVGLFAAVFEWVFAEISYLGIVYLGGFLNDIAYAFNSAIQTANQAANQTGIFAPLIEAVFFGAIIALALVLAALIIKAMEVVA